MADAPEPSLDDHLWTIAVARLICRSTVAVQAPPNLAHAGFPRLLEAGINDWGGVSPVTPDHVNPEAPWPERSTARARRPRPAGRTLLPRLAVYPRFLRDADALARIRRCAAAALAAADGDGLRARRGRGSSGTSPEPPAACRRSQAAPRGDRLGGRSAAALERASAATSSTRRDAVALFEARGPEVELLSRAADALRARALRRRRSPTSSTATSTTPTSATSAAASAPSPRASWPPTCAARPTCSASTRSCGARTRRGTRRAPRSACRAASIPASPASLPRARARRSARRCPTCTSTPSRRSRSGRAPRRSGCRCATTSTQLRDAGLGIAARHRGRDPRRRGARHPLPGQGVAPTQWLEVMRTAHARRPAHDGDDHVRPCRGSPCTRRATCCAIRDLQQRHRRLHRVRAAAVRARGGADRAQGPGPHGPDVPRGGADARGRAARCSTRTSRTSRRRG